MGEQLLSVLLGLLLNALSQLTEAVLSGGAAPADSILQLSAGLNLSLSRSYNPSSGNPISSDLMFTVAIPTLDEGGLFFPILSSPSFNPPSTSPSFINTTSTSRPRSRFVNTSTSTNFSSPFGFSLGFYLMPSQFYADTHQPCLLGCSLYMAVCAGSLGNMTVDSSQSVHLGGALSTGLINPYKNWDGFAAPVWFANLERPIHHADQASLFVKLVADSKGSEVLELQLRDGEHVVWGVPNVDIMEMQDTGQLLLYNSSNRSHLVWQSSLEDSLVQGQKLTVGKELVSNDSSYVARMEKGGLVFYMNNTHFNRERQPPPYWLFPVPRVDDTESLHFDINRMIVSAPCSNSPAHAEVMRPDSYGYGIAVYAGSCSSGAPYIVIPEYSATAQDISWIFWRLERDGMLYSYAVSRPRGSAASVTRKQLDMYAFNKNISFCCNRLEPAPVFLQWKECNVPMACGPLGLCTPGNIPFCSCLEHFEPKNESDIFQGCKRSIDLPNCTFGKGHTGSTDFVQFNATASILLFNQWTFDSTPADVNACKQSCSSDCSCNGFFYQNATSSCFFITDGITLMKVTSLQDTTTIFEDYEVFFTFLKVTSAENTSSELPKGKKGKISSRVALIALSAIILFAVVCLVLGMAGYLYKARIKKYVHKNMLAKEEKELQDILPLLPSRYSYKDLFEATEGFTTLLGAGGFGCVYAGVLPDGRKVAVKVLQVAQPGMGHSKQFLAEIATIGRTCHHNIVRLVGFCWEVSQRLLVYEYLERGSLDHWIFVRNSVDDTSVAMAEPFLDWKTRYSVALGIARGLNYLHEECEQPILHFDIKPQNILLDNDFVAKLADFGMSRLIERNMSTVVTGMRGTPGYIAPEWCSQGTVSKKCDVYSMGMVFLEIVGGRKNLDFALLNSSLDPVEQEAWHFPSWAAGKCEQGRMMELVDRKLHGCGYDATQALRLIHVAFWCIQEDPAMRPNAPKVVQCLEGSCPVEQPPFSMALNAGRHRDRPVFPSFSSS